MNEVVLGKYQILARLSEGSLGSIYLGSADGGAGDPVLIKSISPLHLKSLDAVELFEEELRRLTAIRHDGIAAVLDFGDEHDSHWLVTEYVNGFDLAHWFAFVRQRNDQLPVNVVVHIGKQVLATLEELHNPADDTPSIIHRDLRPSNIIIDKQGKATLTDFGMSRIVAQGTAVIGADAGDKLGYLTPELVANSEPGPESDVYGVGLLLYELLVGENPFSVGNLAATLSAVMKDVAPPVRAKRIDVSVGLSDAIGKALAKKPTDRYPSAADFATAIAAFDDQQGARALRELVDTDFDDPALASLKGVLSLEDRSRRLTQAAPTRRETPWVRPERKPIKQREREQTAASGEVVARAPKHDSQAVWRSLSPAPVAATSARKSTRTTAEWLAIGAVILVALVALIAAAVIFLR